MKKYGQLILWGGVTVLALWYTLRNVSVAEVLASFLTVPVPYLLMTLALMVLTYVARAYRWKTLVHPIQPVRTSQMFAPLMVGFLAGVLPARAGEFVRAYLLSKKQSISFASAFATVVVERLFDLTALMIMFAWFLMFHGEVFDANISWSGISIRDLAFKFGMISVAIIIFLISFLYLLACHEEKALSLVRYCTRPLPEAWQFKILQMAETFGQGLLVVRHRSALIQISIATVMVWACIVLAYYPLYFGYDFQDKSMGSLILLTLMICILITVLPTPGFIGSFNAGVLIALHEIMKEPELATVSFGFVAWGINFLVVLVGGVYFILHDHISVSQLKDEIQN